MKENQVKEMVEYLQGEIALLITKRDLLSDTEKEKMLRNVEDLMRQSHTEVSELLGDELADIYEQELNSAVKNLNNKGLEFSTSLNSNVHKEALEHILQDTMYDMAAAYRTARERFIKNIDEVLSNVKKEIADGTMYGDTRRKTIKRVYDEFYKNGLTSFTTVDGKELPLDFYAETVTRTKISTARVQAHGNTYVEADVNLMQIRTAPDPCEHCAPYKDQVFSVDGKDDRFTHLDVRDTFPLHPNCRCQVQPFILDFEEEETIDDRSRESKSFDPDVDTRTAKQKKMYEDSQRKKRQQRQEMKQYDKMKSVLGNDAPKTLGAFRRMKRQKTDKYLALQSKMRSLNT